MGTITPITSATMAQAGEPSPVLAARQADFSTERLEKGFTSHPPFFQLQPVQSCGGFDKFYSLPEQVPQSTLPD